jgi:hypothetical protein
VSSNQRLGALKVLAGKQNNFVDEEAVRVIA